jgi:protein tyrosine phosphatase
MEQDIFLTRHYMYNETDKSLIQITSGGKIKKSINDFTQVLNYNRTLVDAVDFDKINSTQIISNAGKDFWATSSPLESTVYVFKNEELFYTHTEPANSNYT